MWFTLLKFDFVFTFVLCLHLVRTEDQHKRGPSGFIAVRGKKSIGEDLKTFYEEDPDEIGGKNRGNPQFPIPASDLQFPSITDRDFNKRAPSMGFVGMRGKKPMDFDNDDLPMPKRAPNGFFGMRGKKDDYDPVLYDLVKRMTSGFYGVRGKKYQDDDDDDTKQFMSDKRAPSMGFVGMRGRKNNEEYDKRAPSGFFGMRGKKEWQPISFGLRGKKIPYQFRSKFVGVRGKKNFDDGGNFETDLNDLDINQLMKKLIEDDNVQNKQDGDGVNAV